MTKADSPKPPTKLETITLKVFIHCEGCRRKVKRIINGLDGIEAITIDSESGKVTVTGAVDAKALLQRLQKYGKHAEMWPSSNPAAGKGGNQQNQAKPNNNSSNNKNSSSASDTPAASKDNKKGGGKVEAATGEEAESPEKAKEARTESNANTGAGGGGKKGGGKKGGNSSSNGGGNGGGGAEPPSTSSIEMASDVPSLNKSIISNKNMAPQDYVQTGYTLQSAEYATHMFSDENANNCHIM